MGEAALLIGGGGREDALARAMLLSQHLEDLYCAPGNVGTKLEGAQNIQLDSSDMPGIISFAQAYNTSLVMVGPGEPLVAGLADKLRAEGVPVFGPNASAARLEGSKSFALKFMQMFGIPHPASEVVTTMNQAVTAIAGRAPDKIVLKADGLADGKGVVLPKTSEEMEATLRGMLSGEQFGSAGKSGVVIQERLSGPEVSVFAICNGSEFSVIPLFSQDHKRRDTGDRGPNTGGMGAYTPVPDTIVSDAQREKIEIIAAKTFEAMAEIGRPYQGVLYMGLMLAKERDGDPVVLEYNCRFGDPEAQVLMSALTAADVDVYTMLRETAHGRVPRFDAARFSGKAALTVCLASAGYPENPQAGAIIRNLSRTPAGVTVYHGNTAEHFTRYENTHVVTSGGRALYVTGRGQTVDEAAKAAYSAIGGENGVSFDGMHYRTDIGHQARTA